MAQKVFDKAGYTAIYPPEGEVLNESFVTGLQHTVENYNKGPLTEDRIFRNKDGLAIAVYVKTSQLKKIIERDEHFNGLLTTDKVTLSDIESAKSLRLGDSTRRSARVPAERYIEKTRKNENTFQKEQTAQESLWPDRIHKWGIPVGLVTIIGAGGYIAGRALNATTGLAEKVADDIVTATDIDTSGRREDGLQKVIDAKSGTRPPPASSVEKIEKRRREKDDEKNESPER